VPSIFESLAEGSIFVIASIGLTLTLAVVKLPNFAHAEFLTVGAYVGVVLSRIFPNNLVIVGACAFVVCGIAAVGIHYAVYRPLMDRKVSIYFLVLASFAVAQFVRYIVYSLAASGNSALLVAQEDIKISTVITLFQNAEITNISLIAIVLAVIIAGLLAVFLNFTHLGKSMRAIANNADLARISGINVSYAVNVMWIVAGGLGGLGGVMLGTYTAYVTPTLGFNALLDIFAVVIIAGLTSFVGTIIGGYVVGFSTNTIIEALNYYFGVPFGYAPLLPFAMIVVILLVKPTGLAPNAQTGIAWIRRFANRRKIDDSTAGLANPEPQSEKKN
jgi:neutral amino acid transport system permease protein